MALMMALAGFVNDGTGSIGMSLWILGEVLLLMGILILTIRHDHLKDVLVIKKK